MAAPTATTSSGFTPLEGFLPKNFSTSSCMRGIRVEPPTRITSSIWEVDTPASAIALRQGSNVLCTKSSTSCSNFARVSFFTKCLGTPSTDVMYGRFTSVSMELDNSIFAFSDASFKRCNDMGSFLRSCPSSLKNSSASQFMMRKSKSSPPRWTSPLVDFTSNTPSPSSSTEISNVPPPKSYTAIFMSWCFLSRP